MILSACAQVEQFCEAAAGGILSAGEKPNARGLELLLARRIQAAPPA